MTTEIAQKNEIVYECKFCDFITCKKTDYNRHILTQKHKNNTTTTDNNSKNEKKYICDNCYKSFNDRAGLWRHKKNCNITIVTDSNAESFDKDKLILMLINQNAELIKETSEFKNMMLEQQNMMMAQHTSTQNMMMDVIKTGTHNTTTNNTNSHNKAFNLNFFLNETCKDAMNIMDFVDSIKLQLSDLEGVGELGYIEGISKIIVKNLKELDVTQRPVHCTDQKRETMYIKDEDKWEKDEERLKLHKVVRRVTCKNQNLIPKFKELHPDCGKYHSKFSDQYNKIVVESMGGPGDNDFEKEEKIIKNISKQVFIDKEPV
jgi:hypothetical protein